jgi:hypothetical protein
MAKKLRQIISEEDTFAASGAASTLRPKSRPMDEIDANKPDWLQAIEIYHKLSAEQKARHLDYVQRMLQDSGWSKPGAGLPDADSVAKKNRAFKEENESFEEELDSTLDAFNFTEEAKNKAANLFYAAIENKQSSLRSDLVELVAQYCPSPFLEDEQLDLIEILAEKIQELEAAIAHANRERDELLEEIKHKLSESCSLDESTANQLWSSADSIEEFEQSLKTKLRAEKAPKQSTIEEYLEFTDPDQEWLGEEDQSYIDPQMRKYLDGLKRLQ